MADTTSVRNIMNADPYSIKKNLVTLFKDRLGLEGNDTLEAGFAGYLLQALTMLGSDILTNNAFCWNEAFTTKAKLRTSVNDLAKMFDYAIIEASPCSGNLTIHIEYPELSTVYYKTTLSNGAVCSDSNTQYLVKGTYYIQVGGTNTSIKRKDPLSGAVSIVPFQTIIQNNKTYISFNVDIWQINVFNYDTTVSGATYGEFYDVNISGYSDLIYEFNVGAYIVQDDGFTQYMLFDRVDNIYSYGSTDKVYTIIYGKDNSCTIRFGNGIFGYQPDEGTEIKIVIYTTKGANGAVYANTLTLSKGLIDTVSGQSLSMVSTNLTDINNGTNEEDIDVMKSKIIAQISSAQRLVSQMDYNNFVNVLNISNVYMYPLLLKRDTNANEIDLFSIMYDDEGKVIPTTCINLEDLPIDTKLISKDDYYKFYYQKGKDYCILKPTTVYPQPEQIVEGARFYIDEDFNDESHLDWVIHKGQLATYTNNAWVYTNIDADKKQFMCPFNIRVNDEGKVKIARYEYLPSSLNLVLTLKNQTPSAGIWMDLTYTQINVIPEDALDFTGIKVNFFNMTHNFEYSPTMNSNDIKVITRITNNRDVPVIDKTYKFNAISDDTLNGIIQFSYNIPTEDIPYIEWEIPEGGEDNPHNPNILTVHSEVYYQDALYCEYNRKIRLKQIMNESEGVNGDVCKDFLNTELDYKYNSQDMYTMTPLSPLIENVVFNISSVVFMYNKALEVEGTAKPGYEMIIYLYKLDTVDAERIDCNVFISKVKYKPYTYGIGGNGTVLVYRIKIPYNEELIATGSLPLEVRFDYLFKNAQEYTNFSTYTGNVILRHLLNNTMFSNITEDKTKETLNIYRVPVIEKTYFEKNKELVENMHLYSLSAVDYNFNDYKMLTDNVNIKYATTLGLTTNLKYNIKEGEEYKVDSRFIYKDWAWDIAPTITCEIVIKPNTQRTQASIIEEVRQVIFSFMSMKYTGYNSKIIRSDIVRYIHDTVDDLLSCEITEPTRDIIYIYNERALPKNRALLLSYTPEFIHIDKDKINIKVIEYPDI